MAESSISSVLSHISETWLNLIIYRSLKLLLARWHPWHMALQLNDLLGWYCMYWVQWSHKTSSKKLDNDSELKQNILSLRKVTNSSEPCIWYFWNKYSEVEAWTQFSFLFFFFTAKNKYLRGPKKGTFPQVDEAMLCFITDSGAMQLKLVEIARCLERNERNLRTRVLNDKIM